jgi:hypothetical protein
MLVHLGLQAAAFLDGKRNKEVFLKAEAVIFREFFF